jgi:hypothetical protein
MPIVQVEVVCQTEALFGEIEVRLLANAIGKALASAPGHTWVKLRYLSTSEYAENKAEVPGSELPAFVSVLHAQLPQGEALAAEARAVTLAVAACIGRAPEFVHVQYEPSAAGRQAFGGTMVPKSQGSIK